MSGIGIKRKDYDYRAIPDCVKLMQLADAYGYLEYRRPNGTFMSCLSLLGLSNADNRWQIRFCVMNEDILYIYTSPNGRSADAANVRIDLQTSHHFSTKVYPSGSVRLSKAVLSITSKKGVRHQFSCSPSFNCSHVWFDIFKKALELSAVKPKPFDTLCGKKLSHKICLHKSPCNGSQIDSAVACPLRICPTSLGMQTNPWNVPWTAKDEQEICSTLSKMSQSYQNVSSLSNRPNSLLRTSLLRRSRTLTPAKSQTRRPNITSSLQNMPMSMIKNDVIKTTCIPDKSSLKTEKSPWLHELESAVEARKIRLMKSPSNPIEAMDKSVNDKQGQKMVEGQLMSDLRRMMAERRALINPDSSQSSDSQEDSQWSK